MTVFKPQNDTRPGFVSAKQAQRPNSTRPRTDAEIEAKLRESVKRNASIHKTLAKL